MSQEIQIVAQTLTDNSKAHNLVVEVGDYPNTRKLTIGCTSRADAEAIAEALEHGAAWFELD
jgi:hypothetical protein